MHTHSIGPTLRIAALMIVATSCSATKPAASVPASSVPPLRQRVWVERVEVLDPLAGKLPQVTDALYVFLPRMLQEGAYATDVGTFPGTPTGDDLLLRFRFDAYHAKRTIHPAYIPLAFVTATFYIWVGGPVFTENVHYAGTVSIHRADGTLLAEGTGDRQRKRNLSIYSDGYLNPDYMAERNGAIADMLGMAIRNSPSSSLHSNAARP